MPLTGIHERFRVSCLPKAAVVAENWGATHVISLIDPAIGPEHVPEIRGAEPSVARLRDQEAAEVTSHFPEIVESLFETVRPAIESRIRAFSSTVMPAFRGPPPFAMP